MSDDNPLTLGHDPAKVDHDQEHSDFEVKSFHIWQGLYHGLRSTTNVDILQNKPLNQVSETTHCRA